MLGNIEGANAAFEQALLDARVNRALERVSAAKANRTDYKIDPDSLAALERGDRQRETGIYEHEHEYRPNYCIHCGKVNPAWALYEDHELDRLADDGGPHHD